MSKSAWSFKIVIIGEPSVGKTSLRRSYLGEKFQANYLSTIGADFSFKQVETEDGIISSAIWDLAGQSEYYNVHPQYYRGAVGAMIVFDVTNDKSYEKIPEWIEMYIKNSTYPNAPILIIGNKTDLLPAEEESASQQKQTDYIEELKKRFPNTSSIISGRTSAKTAKNVETCFTNLLGEIINWQKKGQEKTDKIIIKDYEKYILAAYVVTFHEVFGPQIISKSPSLKENYTDSEVSSAIKISSVIDFRDVANYTQITASFPWVDPVGNFTYIAFTVDNPGARGNKALYIIGFVAHRDIKDTILDKRSILDGFLHSSMNQFTNFLIKSDINFITSAIKAPPKDKNIELVDILSTLRKQVFEVIRSNL